MVGWSHGRMETLRLPLFVVACVLIVLALLLDVGGLVVRSPFNATGMQQALADTPPDQRPSLGDIQAARGNDNPPGLGIPYLALVDAVVVFTVAIMAAGILFPQSLEGRIQGLATLIFAIVLILLAIGLAFLAFGKLLLMVSLLLSFPFGPLIYLALFGFFDRGGADVLLSLSMLLKVAFAVCLVLAQLRFLQNVGLILIIATSLVATVIVSFLLGFVPSFLASITDAIAAIIVAILAIIWAIVLLIGSIPAILKALRPARTAA
jgi:hypothetical protein